MHNDESKIKKDYNQINSLTFYWSGLTTSEE